MWFLKRNVWKERQREKKQIKWHRWSKLETFHFNPEWQGEIHTYTHIFAPIFFIPLNFYIILKSWTAAAAVVITIIFIYREMGNQWWENEQTSTHMFVGCFFYLFHIFVRSFSHSFVDWIRFDFSMSQNPIKGSCAYVYVCVHVSAYACMHARCWYEWMLISSHTFIIDICHM